MKVGTEIRRLRELRGLTQHSLAEKAGLSRNYIALIEADKKQPSLASIQAVGRALDVHPSALLGVDERIAEIRKRIAEKYDGLNNVEDILSEIV